VTAALLRKQGRRPQDETGFTLVELMMAMVVMAIVMVSLGLVLVNSLLAADYNRQRTGAIQIANQTIEEVRALTWTTIQAGMSSADISSDANASGNCFQGEPLDVGGNVGLQSACASGSTWIDPSCLTASVSTMPTAATLTSPAPLQPHEQCYRANGFVYGVDVYLTGGSALSPAGPAAPPLTVTVVISWAHPVRGGISDHIVTTSQLSSCLTVQAKCS
jgi:prepilin-type N-terminal cleavage/methylation domain-containing protein